MFYQFEKCFNPLNPYLEIETFGFFGLSIDPQYIWISGLSPIISSSERTTSKMFGRIHSLINLSLGQILPDFHRKSVIFSNHISLVYFTVHVSLWGVLYELYESRAAVTHSKNCVFGFVCSHAIWSMWRYVLPWLQSPLPSTWCHLQISFIFPFVHVYSWLNPHLWCITRG